MHWLTQGLRIVKFRWNQVSLCQHSILGETSLNLYRGGEGNVSLVCFLLPLKREKKMSGTCSLFPPFGDPWPSSPLPSQWLSGIRLFVTPWTVAHRAPLSLGFSRQEYWCGLPFPSPGDLPDPGMEPTSPAGRFFTY